MPVGLTMVVERGRALVLKLPQGEKDAGVRHALREVFAAIDLPLPRQNDELVAAVMVMNMRGPRKRLLRSELERRGMVEDIPMSAALESLPAAGGRRAMVVRVRTMPRQSKGWTTGARLLGDVRFPTGTAPQLRNVMVEQK